MRHLGKVSIAFVVLVSACSMYGEKAPKLRNPVPVKPVITADAGGPKNVDDPNCEFHERAMPAGKPSAKTAELERMGDARNQVYNAPTSEPAVRREALVDVIDSYGRALAGDPFNPTLTLKLALAYDKAYRKGCALALLGRLNRLSNNEKFAKQTAPVIDEVLSRKSYFERYRRDAVGALGY